MTADQGTVVTRDQQLAAAESQATARRASTTPRPVPSEVRDRGVREHRAVYGGELDPGQQRHALRPRERRWRDGAAVSGLAAANLLARTQAAAAAVKASVPGRAGTTKAVDQATSTLASDERAERRSLTEIVDDVATLQNAGACTTVTIVAPAATPAGPGRRRRRPSYDLHDLPRPRPDHHHDDEPPRPRRRRRPPPRAASPPPRRRCPPPPPRRRRRRDPRRRPPPPAQTPRPARRRPRRRCRVRRRLPARPPPTRPAWRRSRAAWRPSPRPPTPDPPGGPRPGISSSKGQKPVAAMMAPFNLVPAIPPSSGASP